MAQTQSNWDYRGINSEGGLEDKDALLSAGFSCPHRADHLQLSATNFQIKTKEALGESGYCLTFIGQKLQVGKRKKQLMEEGILFKPAPS